MLLNVEGHYFLKAYRLAKKELSHLKSKLRYLEENANEVQKRHSDTFAILLDVCNKKKVYKNKYETLVLEKSSSESINSVSQLDRLLDYIASIKLDHVFSFFNSLDRWC